MLWFTLKLLILAIILLPFVLLGYSVSDTALVSTELNPSHYDIARIKKIIKQHDPRQLQQGQTGYLNLSEKDINTLLKTGFSVLQKVRLQSHLDNSTATINFSFKLPDNEYGQYANASLKLKNMSNGLLAIEKVDFGQLSIPGWLIKPVWDVSQQFFAQSPEYQRLSAALQQVQISQQQLKLVYKADWEALRKIKQQGHSIVFNENEQKRLRLYQQQLIKIHQLVKHEAAVSYTQILRPMFQFALQRSAQDENSAIEENRAVLLVLAMAAAGKNLDALIGSNSGQTHSIEKFPKPTLRYREDLMQHFSISAFLASIAADVLARATGLFKEVSDSKGGSGFSFADLAADRAGVEFGSMAVASESSAHSLQVQMAQTRYENDYMPEVDHLPEGLSESVFKHQYGSTESARYNKLQNELDRRIARCRLYK